MKHRLLTLGLLTTCAASALAAAALADPPGRVGRIGYVEGEVSFQPPREDFWTVATRNYPVSTGEAFWTGDRGRAELQIGRVQAWLDSQTELDVVDLDYGETRLALAQGSMDIRVWQAPRGGISISTPAGEVRLDYAGLYRIDVGAPRDDGGYPQVAVVAFEGAAGAPSPDGLIAVRGGQGVVIDAGYAPQPIDVEYAGVDDWARAREARERWDWRGDPLPGVTGAEDLAGYGEFVADPDYGRVWFPRTVPADWAPYRYGHWAFVQPWGWTWIDDQPWGFAPFHYGRWARLGGRWGWIAGAPTAEPVYAPALVAFVGGHGWNIGFGGGGEAMGWVPLAPGEVFRPTYQVSNTYIRQVNVTNVNRTVINNITVNNTQVNNVTINQYRNAPAAVVVRSEAFAHGAPVQTAALSVPAQALAHAPPVTAASRPPPALEARSGAVARAARPGAAPAMAAAAPPPRLMAVRAAVTAQPAGERRPPVIAGARLTPPPPRPAGLARGFVAPAQVRNSADQAHTPASVAGTPGAPPPRSPRTAPTGPFPAAAEIQAERAAAAQQAAARAQAAQAAQEAQQRAAAERQAQMQAEAGAQARAQAEARSREQAARQAEQRAAGERQAQAQAQAEAQARAQAAEQARQGAAAERQAQMRAQAAVQARAQAEAQSRDQVARQAQQRAAVERQAQAQAQARAHVPPEARRNAEAGKPKPNEQDKKDHPDQPPN